ncbi:MAG: tRNA glutamyl-Q(34) synthetase GluQRS [Solirubrobacteraceae bacterium]|nr:tRNA glutamyl-Q(34) synthetase GluQRS [Solirubrobacteraceae bacterium]
MVAGLNLHGPPPAGADGRFAPSPTGGLHLGNLRTALLAWLFARAQGAGYLVRVEDLDRGRVRERFVAEQLADLAALGIDWDGPVVRQSQRTELYEDALATLRAQDLVYECWCTRAEIREAASAPHMEGLPEGAYPGTCRELSARERSVRAATGRPPALRVRADDARIEFVDRLCGVSSGVVDDMVVRRGDGVFAYNLGVVIDDYQQRIGEIVRGADLLDSTPRQLWLQQRLGLAHPGYAHVPLMLGADGARLAKRHGAVTLADRAALGETPERVRSDLAASVGLAAPGERPAPAELVERMRSMITSGVPA